MFTTYRLGPLSVRVNDETGEAVTVSDTLTGLDARLMYSRGDIARATAFAQAQASAVADLG